MAIMKNVVSGKFRGNAGAFKFAQSAGRDIVSERVYTNKSKGFGASYKQRVQRCKIMNLANVYGAYKALFAKAFEGKTAAQSPYNAFTSANLGTSNIHLTKQQADRNCFSAIGLIISKGSLAPISARLETGDIVFNLKLPADLITEEATLGSLCAALIANNSFLKEGDQLTFIASKMGIYPAQSDDEMNGGYYSDFDIHELTLDSTDSRVALTDPYFKEIFDGRNISFEEGKCVMSLVEGGAIILSRNENGRLRVSTQRVIFSESSAFPGHALYSSAENLAAAVASYGSQELALLDPGSEAQPAV